MVSFFKETINYAPEAFCPPQAASTLATELFIKVLKSQNVQAHEYNFLAASSEKQPMSGHTTIPTCWINTDNTDFCFV